MKKIFALLILFLALLVTGFVAWGSIPAQALPAARAALESSSTVTVEIQPWLVFQPNGPPPTTGFIFYPGGRVSPAAYAPAMRQLAEHGYLAVIVPMPLNLAVFAPGRAAEVIAAYPQVKNWVVGGHSLGGSMAADFAGKQPQDVQGLALWASYPAGSNDLSTSSLLVVSIYGTQDGLVSDENLEESIRLLPPTTTWVEIEGGNHAQFGLYGEQSGDNPAAIEWASQQGQIVAATLSLLKAVEERQL